jgi:hypothetical protein
MGLTLNCRDMGVSPQIKLKYADPTWLHQNEMWEELHTREIQEQEEIIGEEQPY